MQVFSDPLAAQHSVFLKHDTQSKGGDTSSALCVDDGHIAVLYVSFFQRKKTSSGVKKGRFARSVRPPQDDGFAAVHGQFLTAEHR